MCYKKWCTILNLKYFDRKTPPHKTDLTRWSDQCDRTLTIERVKERERKKNVYCLFCSYLSYYLGLLSLNGLKTACNTQVKNPHVTNFDWTIYWFIDLVVINWEKSIF